MDSVLSEVAVRIAERILRITWIIAPKDNNKGRRVARKSFIDYAVTVINWVAFAAWIGIWLGFSAIVVDEELGITHTFGMSPITWVTVGNLLHHDPRLFIAIATAFPVGWGWWIVHVYRRAYGDLSKRKK